MANDKEDLVRALLEKAERDIQLMVSSFQDGLSVILRATLKSMVSLTDTLEAVESFIFDMDTGDVPEHNFGPDFKIIEPGPEASTGKVKFSLVSYLDENDRDTEGNVAIYGDRLRERAREKGCQVGQRVGEKLVNFQEKIPTYVTKNFFIPLPATLYKNIRDKEIYFPCLKRNTADGRWHLLLRPLDSSFSTNGRLLILSPIEELPK